MYRHASASASGRRLVQSRHMHMLSAARTINQKNTTKDSMHTLRAMQVPNAPWLTLRLVHNMQTPCAGCATRVRYFIATCHAYSAA